MRVGGEFNESWRRVRNVVVVAMLDANLAPNGFFFQTAYRSVERQATSDQNQQHHHCHVVANSHQLSSDCRRHADILQCMFY